MHAYWQGCVDRDALSMVKGCILEVDIMETASASLSHPNIVQVCIFDHVELKVDVHAIGRAAL
jgi:hypothetical protein